MKPRMKNPALILNAFPEIQALIKVIFNSGISEDLFELASLRVAQINQCELCISQSISKGKSNSELSEKMLSILTWKNSELFNNKEKLILEMAEKITELRHKYDSVPDKLWEDFMKSFNEKEIAGIIMFISLMNMFTRINVTTRQLEAEWG